MHFRFLLPMSETSPWDLILTRLDKNSPFLPRMLGLRPVLNKKAQLTSVVTLAVTPTMVAQVKGVVDSSGHLLPGFFAVSWGELAIGLELTTMWFLSLAAF